MKIKLYNRDGADLWLEQEKDSDIWNLKVDDNHKWIFEFIRTIGYPEREAVDPSGGPYLALGNELKDTDDNKYTISKIINCTTFKLKKENGND